MIYCLSGIFSLGVCTLTIRMTISNEVSETAIEEVASSVRLALHGNHQIKIINEYLYM